MGIVYGVGIYTAGKFPAYIRRKPTKEYKLWCSMLQRCYSAKFQVFMPTYANCSVSENFKNFQWFAEWCQNQLGFGENNAQLDKDLVISGNKVYSEDTCVFVPNSLNMFLVSKAAARGEFPIGVYKNRRENKFTARVSNGGKTENLGSFGTPESAFQAYKVAKEAIAKQLAIKWAGKVDTRVIAALNNFVVDISD